MAYRLSINRTGSPTTKAVGHTQKRLRSLQLQSAAANVIQVDTSVAEPGDHVVVSALAFFTHEQRAGGVHSPVDPF